MQAPLTDATTAMQFMTAGNATLTLRSRRTGARFTYRVREADQRNTGDKPMFFASALTGSDNEGEFSYFGTIRTDAAGDLFFAPARPGKSRITPDAHCLKAFAWAFHFLTEGQMPADLEVWHEGRCGRCGRNLTVPESIASGFGPECGQRICEAA